MDLTEADGMDSEHDMEGTDEAALKLLRAAMAGPMGDCVISVESHDRALLSQLETLGGDGVEVSSWLQKAGHSAGLVWIVLRDVGTASVTLNQVLALIQRVMKMVQSQTKGDKTKAKTKIKTRKNPIEISKLLNQFEKDVDAEIDVPDSEHEGDVDGP